MSKPKTNQIEPGAPAVSTTNHSPADPLAVLTEKVKELVRLAHEQGQLTFDDINEVLTE